jgi:hypothetical protein
MPPLYWHYFNFQRNQVNKMEVYFLEYEASGKRVLHKYECLVMDVNQVKFLGLFSNSQAALNDALLKYPDAILCKTCCAEYNESNDQ